MDQTVSFIHDVYHFAYKQPVTEADPCARFCLAPRLYERLPNIIRASL